MVNGELVFTVTGASAVAARPISLSEAGLRERQHLQEWVIAHPEVLGAAIKIVAFEFGSWTGSSGDRERDRLDILALDGEGRLIVVELKRDKAPDTVDMQALKYAALVSRFTRDDLNKVHARHLTRQSGVEVSIDEATAELDAWAEITEDTLRLPSIILMASDFPQTVTATVVFLHQQLSLDVRLLVFQAYQTTNDVLITVSQHYPPPGIEEFVLSPEVSEAQRAKSGKSNRQREANTVARLIDGDVLSQGEMLTFAAPSADLQEQLAAWLDAAPGRRVAEWQDDPISPLLWQSDGNSYSPTGLARLILEEGAGRTAAVQGPLYWTNEAGQSLVQLAAALADAFDLPLETHTNKLSKRLRPLWAEVDSRILALGPDLDRHSRVKSLKYYGRRKLCDLSIHGDHLSIYIRGLSVTEFPPTSEGVVVAGRPSYIHTQVRREEDIQPVIELLKRAYEKQLLD
jgi:hypothetical protein